MPLKVQAHTMLVHLMTGMVVVNFIRSRQQGRVEHIIIYGHINMTGFAIVISCSKNVLAFIFHLALFLTKKPFIIIL